MPKFNEKRLRVLEEVLRKDTPGKHFNLAVWGSRGDPGSEMGDCGTSACALGHAALIPQFRRAGLRLEFGSYSAVVVLRRKGRGTEYGGSAAATFFGLTGEQTYYLFYPLTYRNEKGRRIRGAAALAKVTPQRVAGRIRALLDNPNLNVTSVAAQKI